MRYIMFNWLIVSIMKEVKGEQFLVSYTIWINVRKNTFNNRYNKNFLSLLLSRQIQYNSNKINLFKLIILVISF